MIAKLLTELIILKNRIPQLNKTSVILAFTTDLLSDRKIKSSVNRDSLASISISLLVVFCTLPKNRPPPPPPLLNLLPVWPLLPWWQIFTCSYPSSSPSCIRCQSCSLPAASLNPATILLCWFPSAHIYYTCCPYPAKGWTPLLSRPPGRWGPQNFISEGLKAGSLLWIWSCSCPR